MRDRPDPFRRALERFIHHPWTEYGLIVLIGLSVLLVVIEAIVGSEDMRLWRWIGVGITGIFILELGIRAYVAKRRMRFLRNYWLDILSVIPLGYGFRILRLLRLLRLVRIGMLANRRLQATSLPEGISSQTGILSMLCLITLASALAIYQLERGENAAFETFGDSLWWSLMTLVANEPIGGEPETLPGRLVTIGVMLSGLTMFAVVTGLVSAVMIDKVKEVMELRLVELDELRGHIVICGWNRSGSLIVKELLAEPSLQGCALVIVAEDTDPAKRELRQLDRSRIYFHPGDFTRLEVLEEVGIYRAAQSILLADSSQPRSDQDRDARTVLAALTIEKLQPQIHTCAQLLDRSNNVQLKVAGVEDIVVGDEITSHIIATSARNRGLTDLLTELLTVQIGNQFYKIPLPSGWVGLTFAQGSQHSKETYDALLLGIERRRGHERESLVNPAAHTRLERGDQLIVIARQPPLRADSTEKSD